MLTDIQYIVEETPDNGRQSFVKNIKNTDNDIDNRWVAPYSPLLSKTFNLMLNSAVQ